MLATFKHNKSHAENSNGNALTLTEISRRSVIYKQPYHLLFNSLFRDVSP